MLRDYQRVAVDAVGDADHVLLVAPTGAGKTVMMAELARGRSHLAVVHRAELLAQTEARGIRCMTVQAMRAGGVYPPADLLLLDEAHHYVSDDWSLLLEHYPHARRIGFTATPCRADGRGLDTLFARLVVASDVASLTAAGYLVPARYVTPPAPLPARTLAMSASAAVNRYAVDRPTVVFCCDVRHATETANLVPYARLCLGDTPDRAVAVAQHERDPAGILVTVAVLTEGWDSPKTSCLIVARGVGHIGLWHQVVGRALRPHPGKSDALIVDLRGMVHIHGPVDAPVDYSLDGKGIRRRDKMPFQFCTVCGAVIVGSVCDDCGSTSSTYKPVKVKPTAMEKYAYKRRETEEEKRECLARWREIARVSGYKPGWAAYKYKSVYGDWPRRRG